MENAYKMRITCNPYTKEIIYECYENDSFVNISELSAEYSSELINDKFTKTSFQNRAFRLCLFCFIACCKGLAYSSCDKTSIWAQSFRAALFYYIISSNFFS